MMGGAVSRSPVINYVGEWYEPRPGNIFDAVNEYEGQRDEQ
jgi:hypothetical protein